MLWKTIYGRKELVRTLQEAIHADKVAHAYLFYGPEGIGKKTIAQVFATALNCLDGQKGCGVCLSCRRAAAQIHPDIHYIEPDGKTIKIDQVRRLKKYAYLKPRESRYQIFILQQADTLTTEAANSLLKVLEEPPVGSIFLLLAENLSALLPTIRSRCQEFAVSRLDRESMAEFLRAQGRMTGEQIAEIMVWAEGIPGKALELTDSQARQQLYQEAVAYLKALAAGKGVSSLAAKLAETEDLTAVLDAMILALRDLLILPAAGKHPEVLAGKGSLLCGQLTEKWHRSACLAAIPVLLKLQRDLQSPINVRLALENAFWDLKEVYNRANSCGNSL
ncbi:MAG: DNA polymerase III subunit delta' [Firmicutes bacterium]|nr:DNA polymerase III subunit delta' [Bacillota bacterium]